MLDDVQNEIIINIFKALTTYRTALRNKDYMIIITIAFNVILMNMIYNDFIL